MSWLIRFPNEPQHFLQNEIIDYDTVVRLVRGELHSQLEQMSRIYNKMFRYSRIRANQFRGRFPQISWINTKEESGIYYSTGNKKYSPDKYASIISRWRLDMKNYLVIWNEDIGEVRSLSPLSSGVEFYLYYDPEAIFVRSRYTSDYSLKDSEKTELLDFRDKETQQTRILRNKLKVGYHWTQDAQQNQVEWMQNKMPQLCQQGIELRKQSVISYEIVSDEKIIGLIYMMGYKMYLTLWDDEKSIRKIFGVSAKEFAKMGKANNIEIVYVNSL